MKLRHQIFFLIAAPILCEVLSLSLITAAFQGVERAGQREIKAKRILTLSQEMFVLLGVRIVNYTQSQFLPSNQPDTKLKINRNLDELFKLTADNGQATQIVKQMNTSTARLLKRMDDLSQAHSPGSKVMYFAQFLESQDYVESAGLAFNELRHETDALERIYEPLSREFLPSEMRARTAMQQTIIFVAFANVVVIIALVIAIDAQSLKRLKLLMDNIRAFSSGKAGAVRLTGNDELAELDRTFAQVAGERLRLEEIRQSMTAMVSHDLRSPLTAMTLSLDFLVEVEAAGMKASAVSRLKQVRADADRLRRMTSTLLDIARLESGKIDVELESRKIDELIEPAHSAMNPLAEYVGLTIDTVVEPELTLYCDCDRTIQVLVNLLSNAIKFSPPNGKIELRAQRGQAGYVRIEVRDSGPGIPPEQQSLLFHKFSQLEQPEDVKKLGSGLGLYICKTLISAQNGIVGVENIPSGGTCFWFELPERRGSPAAEELACLAQDDKQPENRGAS